MSEALIDLVAGRRVVALTGAGCSTESGIPDYRGPETRHRPRQPIQGPAFARDAAVRQRYWARAMFGWERFSRARPNKAHVALARLEASGAVSGVVTQNVDRLHQAAGSRRVVELHGALAEVRCLSCNAVEARADVQERLRAANPDLWSRPDAAVAPDGDADLVADALVGFQIVDCERCGGPLKPNVVFFGDNVKRSVVDDAFSLVDEAEVLLVVGTSLHVFSGYRFLVHASKRAMPIAVVNLGEVRGGHLATLRVDGLAGDVLDAVARVLAG